MTTGEAGASGPEQATTTGGSEKAEKGKPSSELEQAEGLLAGLVAALREAVQGDGIPGYEGSAAVH